MDGGKEYRGDKLTNYAKQHGIILKLTVPYTPEQDGIGNRRIRTVLEKARTIIYDQGIFSDTNEKRTRSFKVCPSNKSDDCY